MDFLQSYQVKEAAVSILHSYRLRTRARGNCHDQHDSDSCWLQWRSTVEAFMRACQRPEAQRIPRETRWLSGVARLAVALLPPDVRKASVSRESVLDILECVCEDALELGLGNQEFASFVLEALTQAFICSWRKEASASPGTFTAKLDRFLPSHTERPTSVTGEPIRTIASILEECALLRRRREITNVELSRGLVGLRRVFRSRHLQDCFRVFVLRTLAELEEPIPLGDPAREAPPSLAVVIHFSSSDVQPPLEDDDDIFDSDDSTMQEQDHPCPTCMDQTLVPNNVKEQFGDFLELGMGNSGLSSLPSSPLAIPRIPSQPTIPRFSPSPSPPPLQRASLPVPYTLTNRRQNPGWSAMEVECLERGLVRFGRQWSTILNRFGTGPGGFAPCRTQVDLKDKARNEARRRQKEGEALGGFERMV